MQIDIYYGDITRTESLEHYLDDKIETSLGDFLRNDKGAHVTMRVQQDRHRTVNRKPHYTVEILLKISWSKSLIKVVKSGDNFKRAVVQAVAAARTQMAKVSSLKLDRRRREPALHRQLANEQTAIDEWFQTF